MFAKASLAVRRVLVVEAVQGRVAGIRLLTFYRQRNSYSIAYAGRYVEIADVLAGIADVLPAKTRCTRNGGASFSRPACNWRGFALCYHTRVTCFLGRLCQPSRPLHRGP